MPTLYKDHLDAIVHYYERLRLAPGFSTRLLNATPASLRNECLAIYNQRPDKRDLPLLMMFFESSAEAAVLRSIGTVDISKFKPLVNFLRGTTSTPNDKNIELLGWLIDFPTRPFDPRFDYGIYGENEDIIDTTTARVDTQEPPDEVKEDGKTTEDIRDQEPDREKVGKQNLKVRFAMNPIVLVCGIVIGLAAISYFVSIRKPGIQPMPRSVLATDSSKLPERITRPDTLTSKHIGKVFYQKRGYDTLDFYTDWGRDPVYPERILHPMSRYIFNKYLKNKHQRL